MVGLRVQTIVWGLGLLLSGCGGRSSELGLPDEGRAGSGGTSGSLHPPAGGRVDSGAGATSDAGSASLGVGGRVHPGVANAAGSSNGGEAPTGDGGSSDEGGCSGEACGLAVNPTPLWVTRLEGYGRGAAWIRFSETSDGVSIGAGQYDYVKTTLDRSTGQVIGVPEVDSTFVATDASGRWLVRQQDQDCVVFDDGNAAFQFQCVANRMVRFSPDGSALAYHSCLSALDNQIRLDVYDTQSKRLLTSSIANLPCLYAGDDWNTLVDSVHRRTLFAHPQRNDLYVFDWATQSVTTRAIHEPSPKSYEPLNREGTILNLSLSHDGQRLVSIGAADGLAWHDPQTLDVQSRVPEVPFFNLYDRCFCTYLAESPVGWSPADEIYATAHASGGIELLSVADGETLAVLAPPSDPAVINEGLSSGYGPALIQFAPDMRHLVALYPRYAVGYSLSH